MPGGPNAEPASGKSHCHCQRALLKYGESGGEGGTGQGEGWSRLALTIKLANAYLRRPTAGPAPSPGGRGHSPEVLPMVATVPIECNSCYFGTTAPTGVQHLRIGLSALLSWGSQ